VRLGHLRWANDVPECDSFMSRDNRTDTSQRRHILKISLDLIHFSVFLKGQK
jgi:hypothetical protein